MKKRAPKQPSTHARLAPSAFKGYEVCPSYVSDGEETAASQRGTMLHGVLEKKVGSEDELEVALADQPLGEDDLHQLWLILHYLQPFIVSAREGRAKVLKEHRFNLLPLKIDGCDGGTGDLMIHWRKTFHIDLFDYKMGWWEVDDAEVNIQIGIYVLGCLVENPWAQTVTAHILQPSRNEISTHQFSRNDVPRILLRARTIADRVNHNAGQVFNPTVDGCLFCDNKANCTALHAMTLRAAYLAQLSLPSKDLNLTPEVFNSIEAAGQVYDFADVISKWAKAIKYKITQFAVDGDDIPGHDLRENAGKRIIVDPEGAYEVLRDNYQVTLSEFLAASDPSITKLLKAVGDHAANGVKGKQQTAASGDLMGAGVITKTEPSAFLVRVKTKKET